MKKRIHQIELFVKYPNEVQEEWRKRLIETAKNTEWGKSYNYASVKTVNDFQSRIPLQTYETLKPYINRLRQKEQNLLWPSDIRWFAKSSGTTNDKSKFIPVSQESMEECHFKGGKDLLSIYCNNYPETKLFSGKGLVLGGSHQINSFNNESYYGDLSAILIQNMPFWTLFIRTPESSIALMDNWEEKVEKMAQVTINENVTSISGIPTWTIVLVKRLLEISGKNNLLEIWPNLELFIHGAVSFTPYKEHFRTLIPSSQMHYLETYNASEGFFGIQDIPKSEEMLLMLDYGIYYEFIPLEEMDKESPKVLTLDQVEKEKHYVVVISTNAGLWRYIIGDTIKFTSLSPYRIKITGRTKHYINAFGEEVIIDNADRAMAIACQKTGAMVKEYTAAPIYFSNKTNGTHEWLIEFEKEPASLEVFNRELDEALKSLNSDYEAKRHKNMALRFPVVKAVPEHTFFNWLKTKGKLGGQHKVPRLSNDRKYIDEIIEYVSGKANMTD